MMKKSIWLFAFAALTAVSCNKDDDQVSPSGGATTTPPAVPTSFTVDEIVVNGFQWYRPGITPLESWDDDNILTGGVADIFVKAYHSTTLKFQSDVISNADHTAYHVMNEADEGALPYEVPFDQFAKVQLWDEDGAFADDLISTVFLTGADIYEDDEADEFTAILYGAPNTCVMYISGRFYYE